MESSLMRSRAPPIFWRNPSCVWVNETALATFDSAALRRLTSDSMRVETAVPAASSAGLVSLEPELSRARDLASMDWLRCRLVAAVSADMLVLMTIVYFLVVGMLAFGLRGADAATEVTATGDLGGGLLAERRGNLGRSLFKASRLFF